MHSFIISGGLESDRDKALDQIKKEWQVSPFDIVQLSPEEGSIAIGGVRAFESALILSPVHGPVRLGLIRGAGTLTAQAQQALLKTLEEPPPRAKIILEIDNLMLLLPTILSRCQVITIKPAPADPATAISLVEKFLQISHGSIGARLLQAESLPKTRPEAVDWINETVSAYHQVLLSEYGLSAIQFPTKSQNSSKILRALLRAKTYLIANINPKLALDSVILS